MSRRKFIIRTVATLTGDLAAGLAVASACAWLIQTAALGMFLSFIAWLAVIAATLAISQHVVHPAVAALLSDRKLDDAISAAGAFSRTAAHTAIDLWRLMQPELQRR